MSELVPNVESLEEVYSESSNTSILAPEHKKRWTDLLSHFAESYGCKPDFVARSPGRVNIIGEHIDYSLYDVLPMAVTVDALIAVKVLPSTGESAYVKVANLDSAKFPSREFTVPIGRDVEIDASKHEWTNYFKAGLRGALAFLRQRRSETFVPASMQVVMDGNVPSGGGMSSSAALVCASALSVMKANGHDVSKQDLLDLAIVSERAVGVNSGGMDQGASIFSKRGSLLYCQFFPTFHAEHVPVPETNPEATFMVAQSFVAADKHVTAPKCYNLRVVECTLAAVMLAKIHGLVLNPDDSSLKFSLRNFQEEMTRKLPARGGKSPEAEVDAMIAIARESLTEEEGYTRDQISSILGISVESLEGEYMTKFPVQATKFLLRQRALHVFEEARRVLEFKAILSNAQRSGKGLNEEKIKQLGRLMNDTQASCRDMYECSCPEIDEICAIARKAGSYGSRLTGAGWGGCTVHLVPQSKVKEVMEALKKEYYFKHFPDITEEKLQEAIVISKPGQGSALIAGAAMDL